VSIGIVHQQIILWVDTSFHSGIPCHDKLYLVVCCVAQENRKPHHEYIDRKKESVISHLWNSEICYSNLTKFAAEIPLNYATLPAKFKANHTKIQLSTFVLNSWFFSRKSRTYAHIKGLLQHIFYQFLLDSDKDLWVMKN